MAATLDNFFGKKDDLRVLYGRGKKPDSEKSVDVRSEERLMSKSPLPGENKVKAVKLCTGDGMKDLKNPAPLETLAMDPETKSIISGLFANSKENMDDKDKDKASVKVYTRRVGKKVFWDTKLQRHRTWEELEMDPELYRGILAYSDNLRINADNCWDSMELENPASFEELGMDPENKGIISDFFGFVRANELSKRIGQALKKDNCLVYDSPGTGRSRSIIAAMANYLKFDDIYHLDLTNFSSLGELQYTLLSTRNRSIIAIEGLYQCAGMLLNLKSDEYAAKYLMMGIDAQFSKRNNERIFVFTTNHRDQHDVASLRPVGMDIYINTSSPLPTSLPDGGKRTYHNSLLVSNSEKENMREACDSTKGYLLPNFDATENKAVKVYSRRGRDWSNSTELERPPTFSELGKDPENEGIISDLLRFVRDKELYKRIGKNWRRGYLLYDSPGTDRSSLIAAMASYLKFDIYDLDLTALSSIQELKCVLTYINKRSLIAIKDIDHWFGMHPNLKKEVKSLRRENKLTLSDLFEIIEQLWYRIRDQQIFVLTTNHNHRDPYHTALLSPLNIDACMHTSSPQPIALPDGGEIVQLDSSEHEPLVDFDATNNRAYKSSVLVSNSEKENTRETSKRQCMTESVLSSDDSRTRISLTDFVAPDYRADLVRAYPNGPIIFTSNNIDTREGLNGECLTKSVLSDDDLTKQELLPKSTSLTFSELTSEDIDGFYDSISVDFDSDSDDFDDGAGMLPDLKDEFVDGLSSSCGDEQITVSTTNRRDPPDAALLPLVNMETDIHTASPQHITLPDAGEIVQLESIEQKPLVDFDATNNRAYQSGVLVSSKKKNAVEAYKGQWECLIQRTKKDMGDGLNRECITKSVLSLDDSSRQKSLPDVDATKNKAHLVRAYQKGLVVSLSENKNRREALKRECITRSVLGLGDLQQHFGGRRDDATKNYGAIYDLGIHTTDSLARKSFKVEETLPIREQLNDCVPLLSIGKLTLKGWVQEEKAQNLPRVLQLNIVEQRVTKLPICLEGLTAKSASTSWWPIGLPDGRHIVVLHPLEQSTKNVAHAARVDQCFPTVSLPEKKMVRKTLKRKLRTMSVTEIHQQQFGRRSEGSAKNFRAMRIGRKHVTNWVSTEKRIHGIHQWPFRQCGKAGESGPTVSNSEKGSMREALKQDSLRDLRQHFGARRKGAAKGLWDSLALTSFEVLDSLSLGKHSNNIRHLAWWRTLTHKHCVRLKKSQDHPRSLLSDYSGKLAAQSAIGLPDGGHIPSLSKKIVKNTLKRKSRTMSVLSLEDHRQHVGKRWRDDANFLGAKHICRQLAVDGESTAKCIRRQHGTSRWPFKQSAIGLPDGGYMLSLSKKKIVRMTFKRKCRNMSVLSLEYHWKVDSKWEDFVKSIGAKHIYRQLVIHFVSRMKRIRRQHEFHRWPFQQNWATRKEQSLGDERPGEFMSLSADGKLVSRLQRIHVSWLGRFSPWPSALQGAAEIVGPTALSSSEFAATNIAHRAGQDQSSPTASHLKKKRTREQEDREEINTSITLNDLRQHYGRKRKDAAESLGVSVSTLKRICRQHGIKRWPNIIRKKVWRPPDPHGERNPSPACETLLTNGQIEMENDPTPSQAMPTITQTMGSSNDWRNLLASQEEPFLEGHVLESFNWEVASCYDLALSQPMTTIPHTMGSLDDSRNLLASQEEPFLEKDFFGFIDGAVASCYDPALSQPMPTILHTMGSSIDWRNLVTSQQEPFLQGDVSGSINWIAPTGSYPALSQPMSTIARTMPEIPLTENEDTGSMELKATYGDTIIKFQLRPMFGISELKEEVSKRREFELGSYKIEYKDAEGDWTLIACNDDIRRYLQQLKSFGKQVIELRVRDEVPNTTNSCEFCRSLTRNRP